MHGLGFAGGLREVGLPEAALPSALGGFALGVELGQLAFLAIAWAGLALVKAARLLAPATRLGAYAVGVSGAYWLAERLTLLLQSPP